MKRAAFAFFVLGFSPFLGVPSVSAAERGAVLGTAESVDKNNLEGWIIEVDYQKNAFRLLDPRGFQRRVITKPGMIGDYRIGDKVRVVIDPDYGRAGSIEKLYY